MNLTFVERSSTYDSSRMIMRTITNKPVLYCRRLSQVFCALIRRRRVPTRGSSVGFVVVSPALGPLRERYDIRVNRNYSFGLIGLTSLRLRSESNDLFLEERMILRPYLYEYDSISTICFFWVAITTNLI